MKNKHTAWELSLCGDCASFARVEHRYETPRDDRGEGGEIVTEEFFRCDRYDRHPFRFPVKKCVERTIKVSRPTRE